jgi:integrase
VREGDGALSTVPGGGRPRRGSIALALPDAAWVTVRKRAVVRTVANAGSVNHMAKSHLQLVTPRTINRTVTPRRLPNGKLRTREYLTEHEVETLMTAARQNRHGHRDATMILIAFRHGLRASEAVDLRWDQVDFNRAVLHVRRAKQGTPSVHPLSGAEMRALRRLQRDNGPGPFVFVSERGAPFTTAGFARMVERAARSAGLDLQAHPHMLRHACGFALANAGHDTRALQAYLGHRNIQHTVRYTELAPDRFKDFWKD